MTAERVEVPAPAGARILVVELPDDIGLAIDVDEDVSTLRAKLREAFARGEWPVALVVPPGWRVRWLEAEAPEASP